MANAGTYFRIMEKCRLLFLRLYSFVCDYVGDSQLDKTPYCDSSSEEKKFQANSLLLFLANYILLLFLYLLE